ncbi:type I restriction enzyme HsdR N-terminal domain-containing protein [Flaviaesturariibacter flavus]|uniref:Type I restriction enzyme HsdR N-terminal domain-containing protein n=1 Tax=Flaviaesturariibacter flavus TaxID=2502780 RepID=A0A4R1B2X7_9BACT|nr:type I restriction enzyme HsdR N-terminal domain-containing protein [Flaviaesturariibacter flavus]TCJ12422.1 type I restriction enzyme HsdR N-terminal domain-containing protein [Flaviaesturariibacter flavus]
MISVRYPEPRFRLKEEGDRRQLFDPLRRCWVALTPEEWVRQNFVNYLLQELHYPASLIALEKEIRLHELRKRFDLLVYDASHLPWMLVECKAPEVALAPAVLDQVLRYNISVPVRFIVITNGNATMAWEKAGGVLTELGELPPWADAKSL